MDETGPIGSADPTPGELSRRAALKLLAAGAAGAAALPALGCADPEPEAGPAGSTSTALAAGTPTDPDLLNPVVAWDGVLTQDELETLAALCDVILPADDRSPSASQLGTHEFIDEWVSAPYEATRNDLVVVRGGLVWLDAESQRRWGRGFADLTLDEQHQICDDICHRPDAAPEFTSAARFFDKVRDLTSTAFWTTEEGMADLGYIGNVPLPSWDGPPREVLERLDLI